MRTVIHLAEPGSSTGSSDIHLLITGFHAQSTVPVSDIVTLLRQCPPFHLQGLQEILYDPLRQMQQPLRQARRYIPTHLRGQYLPHLYTIVLYPFESRQAALHTLAHELGHYVFQHRLDSTLRKQWVTAIYPDSDKISHYARTNAAEDFAESYAWYLLRPIELKRLAAKYAFMQQSVFRNWMFRNPASA